MEFRVLGPVEVRRDGRRAPFSGAKLHTVLAALLVAREEVVSDERLCRLLWGWAPPATVSAQLYTYISRLRKILGADALIDRRPPGYAMSIGNSTLDLREFEDLAHDGREALLREDFEKAGDLLRDALAKWNGLPFANATEYLADAEAPRLIEARTVALELRITADLALGRHEQITGELTGLVAEFPLRERIRCQLMTALYRSGRQADAIHLYHHGRAVLSEELGVNPGEGLQSTYRALLDGTLDRRPRPAPALLSPARPSGPDGSGHPAPAMLPPDTVDFTGRERELGLLCRALAPERQSAGRPRRVLVTGMAGLGKTALAVHAAHRCQRDFPDGQLYADLRSPDGTPRHPTRVLLHLLRALGPVDDVPVTADQDHLVRLYRERTRGRQLLIVLDNASGAAQLGPLLPNTPEPAVLVTGRTALPTVAGAHTVALAPLEARDSMALLAAAAGPDRLAAAPRAASAIVEHCAGLPLALRIVGTRIAARPRCSPDRLAGRLADPATRLRELHSGDLDVHTSLLPSWRALVPEVREVFPVLAGLGPQPFPAADAALALNRPEGEAERLLEALADAALLEVSGADERGQPCYLFHPLVRLFALSLGEDAAAPAEPAGRTEHNRRLTHRP
ncbi:AfsR/SARP family transcriptional regulator [Streptomyces antarcticus]|uniref:AfsR/SARP family transcriptional regulator n=1 Tax=Streptomyces antarcticus TaxID=2996458 RepID=UPI00226F25A1|nr:MULTISPECIES: BTAD domain-containing putative transcriptional regulator [unclassified Streptomyces]MCY0941739.1 BTAD domain-containing putative transcriptional regulator [Streptomyces sp. H34-AA3]MCY0949326.1 BTAD domain-containing putative transcriptional regulator [Streptomyces sp. H27-S2]MCZ4081551.1 BTAD domain-containing putative transcriptional regulator [Streptomyces sp. H34-S5]